MSNWRKEWFTFDRKDRIAIPILILLIIFLSFIFFYLNKFFDSQLEAKRTDALKMALVEKNNGKIDSTNTYSTSNKKKYYKQQNKKSVNNKIEAQLFNFNPNTITHDSIMLLGFSSNEAQAFLNFRNSGAQFYKPEDIQKSFVITQSDFDRLKNYIVIPNQKEGSEKYISKSSNFKSENVIVELNSATIEDLQKIRGIGPSFANRISKYRDLLGGFISKKQLLEVYGIDEEKYNGIVSQVKIETSKVKLLNINRSDVKTLASHPYIDYTIAKSIVAYRKQHGDYMKKEDLKNLHLITDKIFNKIKLYISIQ